MANTITKINRETKHEIAQSLQYALSDTFMLYLKTHTYHWNVMGPQFLTLHQLFEEQYNEMWLAVDAMAERIRSIGEMAPHSQNLVEMATIPANLKVLTAKDMLKDLELGHEVVLKTLGAALSYTNEAQDEATAGMLTERIMIHEKHLWMLKSSC
tara:strand:+ start:86219 stop:86683 length:465 start_codon:yes stop_codon:yes gene_type:complete